MAGLIKENFKQEITTELSWIMNVIDEICSKLEIETYESLLIKYRIQPEEEKAIDKFFVFNIKELNTLKIEEIQEKIAVNFYEMTKKQWSISNEIVEKLIYMKRKDLGV